MYIYIQTVASAASFANYLRTFAYYLKRIRLLAFSVSLSLSLPDLLSLYPPLSPYLCLCLRLFLSLSLHASCHHFASLAVILLLN